MSKLPSISVASATKFVILLVIGLLFGNFLMVVQSNAISPKRYQKLIGPGFSTNWFKTTEPMAKYSEQNIIDVRNKNFSNLRLRCRADLYSYDYTATRDCSTSCSTSCCTDFAQSAIRCAFYRKKRWADFSFIQHSSAL